MKYSITNKPENTQTVLINDLFNTKSINKNSSVNFEIDFNFLNLSVKQYGNNLAETKVLQKSNTKLMISAYKKIVKLIKFCNKNNINFNNCFFVNNLTEKQNNNDVMLTYMLEIKFNTKPFKKLNRSVDYACEFLDLENSFHNMCDFKDNKCAKHRDLGFDRINGCCPAKCKHLKNCPCTTKNLSCKLIMCDYLMNKGYYFSPHNIPVLSVNLSFFERIASWGMFFKTTKQTYHFLRFIIFLEVLTILILPILILGFIV